MENEIRKAYPKEWQLYISCGQEPQGDCQLQTRLDGLSHTGVLPRDGGSNRVQDFQEYIWCQPCIVPEHSGFSGFSIAHVYVQQIVVVAQLPPPCLSEPVLDPYGSPRTLPHILSLILPPMPKTTVMAMVMMKIMVKSRNP